jgi:xylulokinase
VPALIGIDIGTTGAKGVLINERGKVLLSAYEEYPLSLPKSGWAEQNPEDWYRATVNLTRQLLSKSGIASQKLSGLALSGQMHGLVCMDEAGNVLRPAILWCDTRTTAQCRFIEEKLGSRKRVIQLACNPPLEGFTLPKLLWVQQNEPRIFAKIKTVLLPKDYVRFRLTGCEAMDLSDAAGTLMLDVKRKRWSKPMLEPLGISTGILPPLGESPEIAGYLTPSAADSTGLPVGLPVAFGGADNTCAAIGNGVIREGIVAVSIGTSGTVVAPTKTPILDKAGRVHTFNHSVPGLWYVMGVMQAAGLSLKWFRDTFGQLDLAMAAQTGGDAYEYLTEGVKDVPAGAEGLVYLPYLNGERTPHLNANARGVLFGLSPRHTRAHVVRAIMEGVAFGLRDSIEIIRALRVPIEEIRITGGGARSAVWRQIIADVFQQSIVRINAEEGPAFGAAIIAGVATGVFSSFESATDKAIRVTHTIKPNLKHATALERTYRLFQKLYTDLKVDFDELQSI